MTKQVSIPTLRRLPSYYNIICDAEACGDKFISSATIAKLLLIDDTQVRKDIAATGYVGKPKVGFDIVEFKSHLEEFLGLKNTRMAFLVGAGNLGIALSKYMGFKRYGLEILALFDNDPLKQGIKVENKEVFPVSQLPVLAKEMDVQMAILTVPYNQAQNVTDFIVEAGIKAIWNFTTVNLKVPDDVLVQSQDLASSFVTFSLMFTEMQKNI